MLSHPNIVSVYDVSRSGNVEYIVMELIEGITLKQYINRKGLLNWKEALHFATQVTKALSHAHSRGIIHRDIKPHNIMILKDGSVKVADFGIARLLSMSNTLTQEALGSVHYISPEQAKGGGVDARSDIYSLGVVMYEMLTSRLPFVGESAVSVAIQHISAIPLMPRDINPEIPVGLEDITMHAMEPDISLRFTTADEMLRDLEEFRKNPAIVYDYILPPDVKRLSESAPVNEQKPLSQGPQGGAPPPKSFDALVAEPERVRDKQRTRLKPVRKSTTVKPDLSGDEYRTAKTRASNTSTLVGVFGIVVFIVAVLIFMWNFLLKDIFNHEDGLQITIPNFVNQRYDDLLRNREFLEDFNFIIQQEVFSSEIAEGRVVSQSPSADRQQTPKPGNRINIYLNISRGNAPPDTMPFVVGIHYAEARNQLRSLNLELIFVDEEIESDVERGYVVDTRPSAGSPLARGDTVVLVRSIGAERVATLVPDLLGSTREVLERMFRDLQLTPDFRPIDDESPEGTVLYIQNMNQQVYIPETIIVYISKGPPEPPEQTPEPSPDPTPEPPPDPPDDPPPETSPDTTPDVPPDPPPDTPPDTPPDPAPSDGGYHGEPGEAP